MRINYLTFIGAL